MFKSNIRLIFRINVIVWTVCALLIVLLALMFNKLEKQELRARIDQFGVRGGPCQETQGEEPDGETDGDKDSPSTSAIWKMR